MTTYRDEPVWEWYDCEYLYKVFRLRSEPGSRVRAFELIGIDDGGVRRFWEIADRRFGRRQKINEERLRKAPSDCWLALTRAARS